jgi:GNAT superfamily N-acetyltransferase
MNRTLSLAPADELAARERCDIREAAPGDADIIRTFVAGLSVHTQYMRFFTAVAPPSPGLLRLLAGGGTGKSDILLVTDECGGVIGHGMAVDVVRDGVLRADIGLVVADSWQGRGLGTRLLSLLSERAARRGVAALVLDILPSNARMLGIISRRWPDARRTRTLDSIMIEAPLAAPALASAAAQLGGVRAARRPAA